LFDLGIDHDATVRVLWLTDYGKDKPVRFELKVERA
jgi:hypothetical protein